MSGGFKTHCECGISPQLTIKATLAYWKNCLHSNTRAFQYSRLALFQPYYSGGSPITVNHRCPKDIDKDDSGNTRPEILSDT